MNMLVPTILCGGAGTRLWPASRVSHPKPFLHLPDGLTLLEHTVQRASSLPDVHAILTLTHRDYYFRVKDLYQALHQRSHYILEPCARNTAPALAMAALYCQENFGADACMLVLPADHIVKRSDNFQQAVAGARSLAEQGYLVTFGIVPQAPETGYGYIQAGVPLGPNAYAVTRFVEKPDAATAAHYLAAGNYFWNAGMFCFQAGVFLQQMQALCPELWQAATRTWAASAADRVLGASAIELNPTEFQGMPDISIDYALMERAERLAVVTADLGWSDIGSWSAMAQLIPADSSGNRVVGDALVVDTSDTYIQSEQHLVATLGVRDLVIVDTDDAVLVAHRDQVQKVKQVVELLKERGHRSYREHRTAIRPWGSYTVLEEGPRFKIKRIEVKPGGALSLQLHHHRSEHWVVVSGIAKVILEDREFFVDTNQSTFIPAGHKHRLINPGKLDLVLIEVQSGDYLGEDDIVRFDDQYGRSSQSC